MQPTIRTPYQYLPTYAKVSIERLDADSSKRTGVWLDEFLNAYAKTYGLQTPDMDVRESAFAICSRRFGDTFKFTA